MEKNKKIKFSHIIYLIAIVSIIFLLVVGSLIYGAGLDNRLTRVAIKFIPFPAAIINYTNFITLDNVGDDLASIQSFYEIQDFSNEGLRVDFETEEGRKRLKIKEKNLLNKMMENAIIEKLSKEKGIKLSKELISQEVDRKLLEFGNREEVQNNLLRLYGWDIEEFKEKIVKPEMYKEKLMESFIAENSKFEDSKNKIESANQDLVNKKEFAAMAIKYSEGESAKNGGELGWLSADQMLPQISAVAFQLKKMEFSQIIQSSLGFHIIQVEDVKNENSVSMVRLRQILVRVPSFGDWLAEKEKNFKISVYLSGMKWNNETQQVEFTDEEMKKFEDNIIENSAGDASVLF